MKTPISRQRNPFPALLLLTLLTAAALLSCQPPAQTLQPLTPQQIEYLQTQDPYRTPATWDEPAPLPTRIPYKAAPLRPPWPVLPRPNQFQDCSYPTQDFIPAIKSCIGRRS